MSKKRKDEAWGENGFEDWGGYMNAKKAKLEEQFHIEANKEFQEASGLLKDIAIFVNGYTNPTADELRRLMMAHGGTFHHYMRPRITTHIIASNLPYSKIVLYRKSQNPLPICKPEWIMDSIKAGRVLNFQNYLLYTSCTDLQSKLKYQIKSNEEKFEKQREIQEKDCQIPSPDNDGIADKKLTKESTINEITEAKNNALCTKNSGFLSEFYNNSRLHHIATMGATFKDYVNELRDKSNGKFPGLARLKELKDLKSVSAPFPDFESSDNEEALDPQDDNKINEGPIIMHIDMDCFFVSVGLRDKPELKGLPVAVTHAKGNKHPPTANTEVAGTSGHVGDEYGSLSEVASCSYEARRAGVKNGMFLGEALRLCPNLQTISYNFEGYKEVSYKLYDTVSSYTLDIEAVSCDEMYADCTKILEKTCLTPMEFASSIRKEIKEKTGCPVSTGFGSSKLLARLATKKAKPDGQFYINKDLVQTCISTLNVRELPGVGGTTAHKLNGINVRTCAELQAISLSTLQKEFGKKTGELLYNMCRGVDNSKLSLEHVRKSVSAEVNYGIRFENNEEALNFLKKLSEEVCARLKKNNAKGRCITLKLMVRAKEAPKEAAKFMGHGLCDYMTRSKNLIAPINDVDIITKEVTTLWNQLQQLPEDARGIGIQISRLEILKNKSRDVSLASFVSKNKRTGTIPRSTESNNSNDTQISKRLDQTERTVKPSGLRAFLSSKQTAPTTSTTASTSKDVKSEVEKNSHIPDKINNSILAELPEDIRNEILSVQENRNSSGVPNKKEKKIRDAGSSKAEEKNVQTHQEEFFKHTKSISGKSTKPGIPALEEIDLAVLVELPEDIRNEILNEYSSSKRQNESNVDLSRDNQRDRNNQAITDNPRVTTESTRDKEYISFSQVDPDFLAALSEDLRRDVQTYCATKKKDHSLKVGTNEEVASTSNSLTKELRQTKKSEGTSKVKTNGKSTKTMPGKNNRKKGVQAALKNLENKNSVESKNLPKENYIERSLVPCMKRAKAPINGVYLEENEKIISHNRTISEKENTSQHDQILINLVNHLFNLPLRQVKVQIQTWITNSKVVNEVDFLSLATFLSMLPEKKRIEDLHVLLKTMHRCMTKTGNCIWHKTYRKTVKHVQHYMQIEYNSNLMVPPIRCNLLQCNSDVM